MNTKFNGKLSRTLPPPVIFPLLISYMFEHIGISIYWIFFALDLFDTVSDSYFNIALVFAIPAMLSVFGTTFLSNLTDKTKKHKLILFLSRLALMIQYILLLFFNNNLWVVIIILACFGLVTQIYYSVHGALLTIICPPDRRGQVTSYQVIFASAGWMIGGGVSDIIKGRFGIEGNLGFAAFFVICAGAIALLSKTKPWGKIEDDNIDLELTIKKSEIAEVDKNSKPGILEKMDVKKKTSFIDILKRRKIIFLLLTLLVLDFGFGPFNSITSIYFRSIYENHFQHMFPTPEELDSYVNWLIKLSNVIATGIGMIILLSFGRLIDKKGRKPFIILAIAFYPLIYSLMFFFSNHPWAMFSFYLYPLYALKVPTANTIMSDLTSEDERARGMSLITIEQIFAGNLGAIIGASVADHFPGDWIPRFVPEGIFIIPLFPVILGTVALIMAIFFIKETNPKAIKNKIEKGVVVVSSD